MRRASPRGCQRKAVRESEDACIFDELQNLVESDEVHLSLTQGSIYHVQEDARKEKAEETHGAEAKSQHRRT